MISKIISLDSYRFFIYKILFQIGFYQHLYLPKCYQTMRALEQITHGFDLTKNSHSPDYFRCPKIIQRVPLGGGGCLTIGYCVGGVVHCTPWPITAGHSTIAHRIGMLRQLYCRDWCGYEFKIQNCVNSHGILFEFSKFDGADSRVCTQVCLCVCVCACVCCKCVYNCLNKM